MKLNPLKSIGPFMFNSELINYVYLSFSELPEEYDEVVGWQSYTLPQNDVRIYTENGKIVSVACYDECILGDFNLVGLEEGIFKSIIQSKLSHSESMELDNGIKDVLEYDDLGIQACVKDGFVESITCCGSD